MKKLLLKIITPERLILEEEVEQVTVPTTEGELTILPEHIAIIANIASGDIVALKDGIHIPMATVGGFLEVKKVEDKTEVAILADFAEHVGDITEEKIRHAQDLATELKKKADNNEIVDFEHFESELARSLTRIKIADKWKVRKYRK